MLNKDEIQQYEEPLLDHTQMLRVTGVPRERHHLWTKRGLGRVHPGRGHAREYSIGEVLYFAYVKLLLEAGVLLDDAGFLAGGLFPEFGGQVLFEVADLLRSSDRPDACPRVLAVVWKSAGGWRQALVNKTELENPEITAPVPAGSLWAIVVDLTAVVNQTMNGARLILKSRKK